MDCVRIVTEFTESEISALVHPEWFEAFPWLLQGTTTRGSAGAPPFDFGLFGETSRPREARERWSTLQQRLGARGVVYSQQVHGADVCEYEEHSSGISGLELVDPCDGHVTSTPGLLLAVTAADCVPVFVIDPERRAVAVLHAGWRGAAAGVIESGVKKMASAFASRAEDLRLHMGPAICGTCYEVGPEVFAALREPVPDRPAPIDLRHVLAEHAVRLGVSRAAVTISAHCTICTESGLFSHRKGHRERQVGYIGVLD
ncbi:MAG TPA: hypothetical protein DEF01_00710 [Gemmatimonadetes bacterium]|nr:hypothetical protein [Gemmatimonadota bacterium]